MRKIIISIITIALLFSCFSLVFAQSNNTSQNVVIKNNWKTTDYKFVTIPTRFKPVVTIKEKIGTENVLFIGNSLCLGLKHIADKHSFIAIGGVTLAGLRENGAYNKIKDYNFDTVVIGVGTNELGWCDKTWWKTELDILFDAIYSVNPHATIVIMSTPPLSQERNDQGDNINNKNVTKVNQYFQEFAKEYQILYLDNYKFFGDVLNDEISGDGIHLNPIGYREWYQFILEELNNMYVYYNLTLV